MADSVVDAILSGASKKKPELYDALGCTRDSSIEQITAEFKARVRSAHPDKVEGGEEEFVKIKTAYEVLTNPACRRVYDLWLDSPLPYSYQEFAANQEAIRQSMHWVTPNKTPMIKGEDCADTKKSISGRNAWAAEGRHQSDAARRFREYKV